MSASNWEKVAKQLIGKKVVLEKFKKHNKPTKKKTGVASRVCENCGRFGGHIRSYGLNLCRQCFREIAVELGFKKYS